MGTPLLWESVSRPLLMLHAVTAMALMGAVTHQAILNVGFVLGRFSKHRLEAVYVKIVAALYPVVFLLGAVIYPTYRIRIRAEIFDLTAPWASNLFDMKENLAALGLAIALTQLLTRPHVHPRPSGQGIGLHITFGLSLAALTWAQVIMGLWLTAEEGL